MKYFKKHNDFINELNSQSYFAAAKKAKKMGDWNLYTKLMQYGHKKKKTEKFEDMKSTLRKIKTDKENRHKLIINDYDILVSNGCPYILPLNELKKAKYVNVHPSLLPNLKGIDPVIALTQCSPWTSPMVKLCAALIRLKTTLR